MEKQQILGESNLLAQTLEQLSLIAPLNKPVIIAGERGTGKELIAERLHFLSERWQKPFLKINCAALSDNLLDSALFGHEAGAFTGASKISKGYFERANEGTLFLDELGTVSTYVQEKLLRVIEYGEYERLGGQQSLQADVRIIAATNDDLVQLSNTGKFRADLLDRLAFDVINVPPLRYRQEDILILAEHFAIAMSRELERPTFRGFTPSAAQQLNNYPWPGNVRELKNVVQRSDYRHQEIDTAIEQIIFNPFATTWPSAQNNLSQPIHQSTSDNTSIKTPNKTEPTNAISDPAADSVITEPVINNQPLSQAVDFKSEISNIEYERLKHYLAENHYHQKHTAQSIGLTYHQLRAYLRKYPSLIA